MSWSQSLPLPIELKGLINEKIDVSKRWVQTGPFLITAVKLDPRSLSLLRIRCAEFRFLLKNASHLEILAVGILPLIGGLFYQIFSPDFN